MHARALKLLPFTQKWDVGLARNGESLRAFPFLATLIAARRWIGADGTRLHERATAGSVGEA